jgi:hypothetical protein
MEAAAAAEWSFPGATARLPVRHAGEDAPEFRGPFFRDYIDSLKGFSGWDDGDEWVANYLGHPLQGAVYGLLT